MMRLGDSANDLFFDIKNVAGGLEAFFKGEFKQWLANQKKRVAIQAAFNTGRMEAEKALDRKRAEYQRAETDRDTNRHSRRAKIHEDEMTFTLEEIELLERKALLESALNRPDMVFDTGGPDLTTPTASNLGGPFSEAAMPTGQSDLFSDTDIYEKPTLGEDIEKQQREEAWLAEVQQAEREKQLQADKHEWMLQNSKDYAQAQRQITLEETMGRFQATSTMFANLSALMNTENKKAFKIGKAAAIASATINTANAAIKAYQSMAGIPYVGPALGIAAAAAAVAAGTVQIVKIKNTKLGSGSGGIPNGPSGAPGGGSLGGGAFSGGMAQTPTPGGPGGSGGPTVIKVQVGEATLLDALVDMNESAAQSGSPSFKRND
jgi:hypothetical protein